MNLKKHILNQSLKKNIRKEIYKYALNEGIYSIETDRGQEFRPDLKYYAFDWDDNIMYMPTKILVMSENDDEIGMTTEDFAEHRHQIGVEDFKYNGSTIVGYAPDPFKYFKTAGDDKFIVDSLIAPVGPAWNDFVECINGGSIFSIITARGHHPDTLRKGIFNLIAKDHNGINKKTLINNLKLYREMVSGNKTLKEQIEVQKYEVSFDGDGLILEYLDLCLMAPVSFGEGSAASPEHGKKVALRKFISDCRQNAKELVESLLKNNPNLKLSDLVPKFKMDMAFMEVMDDVQIEDFLNQNVNIGFSDDDERNVVSQAEMLKQEYPDEPISLYLTKGGKKEKYNY